MNKNKDKGSRCLKPLRDKKNPFGSQLVSTENLIVIQCFIHLIYLEPKPIFINNCRMKL